MKILKILQVLVGILLIVSILLQNRGASVSGLFGGSGTVFRTKRGIEKSLFYATIALAAAFFIVSFLAVIL